MWYVEGYEISKNQNGEVTGYTLHCSKQFKGETGYGKRVKSFWIRPALGYVPAVNDHVIIDVEVRTFGDKAREIITGIEVL